MRIPIGSFGHHTGYVYDFATLRKELETAGFRDVVSCAINESAHEDLAGIDQRSGESAVQMAVEATRCGSAGPAARVQPGAEPVEVLHRDLRDRTLRLGFGEHRAVRLHGPVDRRSQ